jgi:hypothetical protein
MLQDWFVSATDDGLARAFERVGILVDVVIGVCEIWR